MEQGAISVERGIMKVCKITRYILFGMQWSYESFTPGLVEVGFEVGYETAVNQNRGLETIGSTSRSLNRKGN